MKTIFRYSRIVFLFFILCCMTILLSNCQKEDFIALSDEDSDQPEWAGGDTDANDHIQANEESGTTRGGDYGDLYVLLRDANGVPSMTWRDLDEDGEQDDDEFFVQPIDADGNKIELDQFGEVPEGAPVIEVDFGRLNIVRSPQSVLDQAFEEAMKVINAGDDFTLDYCGRLSIWNYNDNDVLVLTKTIDSPRENMAMYQYLMKYMYEETEENNNQNRMGFLGETYHIDPLLLATGCFSAGSDKTGTVDIDEVVYINGFLDCTGLNPILNEHDYDFNNDENYYWNFTEPRLGDAQFQYKRDIYKDRYIQFLVWDNEYFPLDENGISQGPVFSIYEIFEGEVDYKGIGDQPEFTYDWSLSDHTKVLGFAIAIDDAVQVLDFIHGDSNIIFLPNYQH
ncbi:hypothetical protein SLH46_09245 [Draconibacterium sp. IB214405]|uniref:hypothetical protein n=1 Tax=Draconibacterium sp. IB214405 TaxID=3097352 RepID=UPI002A17315A|nr:hypothetical protein [Draconibacterium sp. IB214405]MDX8339365.1 hypothetical protein [Draconibacterium sp. IB214405]